MYDLHLYELLYFTIVSKKRIPTLFIFPLPSSEDKSLFIIHYISVLFRE